MTAYVNPRSALLITLDSCRYDTFLAAHAPNLKSVGADIHRAQAPSHFTYGSHKAMFVGFTPGVAGLSQPFVNPKFAKFFRIANGGRLAFGPAAFELEGRDIIQGFGTRGYRTIGSGALGWFNPETPMGATLTADFDRFFYPHGIWFVRRQAAWLDAELDAAGDAPVFVFLNVGETHVPYWHEGADWSPGDNPCVPFQTLDRAADCAHRQRACLEYVDAVLAGVLARFAHATVVVTADHGDCWGEDGIWEHGIGHEMVLTVPLVFRVAPEIDADRSRRHNREAFLRSATTASGNSPAKRSELVVSRNPDILFSTVDGDVLGLQPSSGEAFRLNATAAVIWEFLASPRTEHEIRTYVGDRFDVDEATCRESVTSLLAEWRRSDLVRDDHRPAETSEGDPMSHQPLTLQSLVALRTDLKLSTFDDEVVIVDVVNESYHAAGATGSRIIDLLDGQRPVHEIVTALTTAYDIDQETCAKEVLGFLGLLHDQRLLHVKA
jgi:hypothetical protein